MILKLLSCSNLPALVGLDFQYSYCDTFKRTSKIAQILPQETTKAAIYAENAPEWIFACYGTWQKGATVIPIDAKSNVDEVAFVLSDAEPEVIFTSIENEKNTQDAVKKAGTKTKILVLEKLFENVNFAEPQENSAIERNYEDLGLIVYTSGTTGNPKGVMLSFANLAANMNAVIEAKYFFEGVRVLAMLPFHHILPLMGTQIVPLAISGKIVFPKSIAPADISAVLQKYPVDMVVSVPRFYEMVHANIITKIQQSKVAKLLFGIAKLVDNMKFSQKLFGMIHKKFGGPIKYWISGGAALDKKVWSDLQTLGFPVREGYGMTECAPIISFPRINKVKMGSPGQPLQGIEVKIDDGEIIVKGANVTSGYYNRPEETAQSIRNGWLYTGDLGYIDNEGFLFITGRRKEIIVLANGKNLNPAEMEINLQRQSADILETAVLMYEGTLRAIVRVNQTLVDQLGNDAVEEKIRNEAILPYNRNSPMYKRIIKFVLTTEELPRTRVGKLKRHQLASYIEKGNTTQTRIKNPEPETAVYSQLKSVLEKQISLPVDCDVHMEMDLGLDSLGKIALQCFVEENYGVKVAERDFEKYQSLRLFAEMVEKNRDTAHEGILKKVSWADIIKSSTNIELKKPHFFHFLTVSALKNLSKLLYKTEYIGIENLPENTPVIITPNHQSFADGALLMGASTKTQIYKTYFFAKIRSYIRSGWFRNFVNRSNVIVMDINENVKSSIGKLAKALKEGNRVVIFPEGTRTKDGDIAEFKSTFAIIAKEMKIPVIPVCISGAFEKIKVGKTMPKFGSKIKVQFLKQMLPDATESYENFAERVREEIDKVLQKERCI